MEPMSEQQGTGGEEPADAAGAVERVDQQRRYYVGPGKCSVPVEGAVIQTLCYACLDQRKRDSC